jgi:hypothetical protein
MLKVHAEDMRSRLRLTASALVVAAACAGMTAGADASTITLSSSNSPIKIDGGTGDTIVVTTGTAAYMTAAYNSVPSGDLGLVWSSANLSADSVTSMSGSTGQDKIQIEKGATLYINNDWWWESYQSMFQSAGDITIDHGTTYLLGTNTLTGNLTIETGTVYFGAGWVNGQTTFGTDTKIILGSGGSIGYYNSGSIDNVINTISSADATSSVTMYSGNLTVNGVNTATSAFYGTVNVNAGATFAVGDASHSSAVFGDPSGSTTVVNVNQSGGSLGILEGYGTIYGSVTNNGLVKPGGTSGTTGTLTITGDYTQGSTGQLKVEISPTSASSLVVGGTATIDGTLNVNIDDGTYGNTVYEVLSASNISGSFSSISTSGSASGVIIGSGSDDTGVYLVTEKSSGAQAFGHLMTAYRTNLYQFANSLYDTIELGSPEAGAKKAVADGEIRTWFAPFGRLDNIGRDGVGYNNKTVGATMGTEYRTPWRNAVVGAAFSYSYSNMDVKNEATTANTDAYTFAVYGGADLQFARVDGMMFYGFDDNSLARTFSGYGTANATPRGWSWGGSVQISNSLFDNLITPYVRGTFARISQDSEAESGVKTFDLSYDGINKATFAGDLGFKVHLLRPEPDLKAKLEMSAAIRHDFSDAGETVSGGFADLSGSSFTYKWDGNSANALLVGLNFSDEVMNGLDIYTRVNGIFTTNQRAGEVQIGARYRL